MYALEVISGGTINIPSLMMIGSSNRVILGVLSQQFQRLIVLVFLIEETYRVCPCFMRHDIRTKFHEDWHRRSDNIKVLPHKFERL
jgi:hypothetical protein